VKISSIIFLFLKVCRTFRFRRDIHSKGSRNWKPYPGLQQRYDVLPSNRADLLRPGFPIPVAYYISHKGDCALFFCIRSNRRIFSRLPELQMEEMP